MSPIIKETSAKQVEAIIRMVFEAIQEVKKTREAQGLPPVNPKNVTIWVDRMKSSAQSAINEKQFPVFAPFNGLSLPLPARWNESAFILKGDVGDGAKAHCGHGHWIIFMVLFLGLLFRWYMSVGKHVSAKEGRLRLESSEEERRAGMRSAWIGDEKVYLEKA